MQTYDGLLHRWRAEALMHRQVIMSSSMDCVRSRNSVSIREVLLYASAVRSATPIKPWQSLGMSRNISGWYASLNPDIEHWDQGTQSLQDPPATCNHQIKMRHDISGNNM